MEAWRLKALNGALTRGGGTNTSVIGLRQLRNQYQNDPTHNPYDLNWRRWHTLLHAPVIQTIGFSKDKLREVIAATLEKLPQRPRMGAREFYQPLTRNYIRYEGENAVNDRGIDMTNKPMAGGEYLPKRYYMMIYNELMIRGFIQ